MNGYTSSPSYVAGNESYGSAPALNTFPMWLQTFQMQVEADLVHDLQPFFPELSQGQALQINVPTSLSQTYIARQTFLTQDDAGLVPVPSELNTSALYQNEPAPPQPISSGGSEVSLTQGANPGHDPPPFVTPAPSQSLASQLDARTAYPCSMCGRNFRRSQERNRHIRTFLPHSFHCPFQLCPWRGDRYDNLKRHWKTRHATYAQAPEQPQCQIYDPGALVKKFIDGELSIESAATIAQAEVEIRAEELGKISIWADWWGRQQKGFNH